MKTLLALLLTAAFASAADLKLAWDDAQPGATYRIEISPAGPDPAWTVAKDNIPQLPAPAEQETTLAGIAPGVYMLRAFATVNGLDSEPSEILMDVKVIPSPPGKPRVVIRLEKSSDLKNWNVIAAVHERSETKQYYRTVLEVRE